MNGNFKCPGVTPSSSCCVPQTKFDEKNRFLHSTVIETISFTQGLAYCSHFLHISCLPVTGIKSQDILQPPCDGNKVSGYTSTSLCLCCNFESRTMIYHRVPLLSFQSFHLTLFLFFLEYILNSKGSSFDKSGIIILCRLIGLVCIICGFI